MGERGSSLLRIVDDARIAVLRSPVKRLHCGVPDGESLPPRQWETLRLQLQEEYRLATGEPDAVLIVQLGSALSQEGQG